MLLKHFRDKDRRKEFSREYKEIEMLYEIIAPDAFLRPFIDDYRHVGGHLHCVTQGLWETFIPPWIACISEKDK